MSLGDFLGDQSLGTTSSWADEMEDMPAVPAGGSSTGYARREYGDSSGSGGGGFGGFSRNDREERHPPREQLPIPDKPPFTAHVGNLSFDVSENEISEFFQKCDVSNVRLVRDKMEDRPKGFGYVEFNTREGLVAAIEMNGSQLSGRNIRINVADPPKDRGEERTLGEWRRTGPLPTLENTGRRGSERGGFGDRGDRGGYGDRDRMGSESGDRVDRRQSAYEGSDKLRNLDKWERTGPLPPSTPTASEHRPRSGERNDRGEPREFRRRSPAPSAEGTPKREYRERPAIERQPTAPERDNEWRRGARPDPPAPQRTSTAPSSPVAATTRPRLELKKRSEHPIEPALTSATSDSSSKPNPFGAARPIDTSQRDKEVEERRLAALAAKRAKDEKAREERKARAAAAGETDKSEAGTPTTNKDLALLRRASGATEGNAVEGEAEGEAAPAAAAPPKRREERPAKTTPSNWRKQEPKEAPVEEAADGWSTVPAKKGRAAGARV